MPGAGRTGVGLSLAAGAAAAALALGAYGGGVLREPELSTVDARFAIRGETAPPRDLVLVLVDDRTFNELDERWPFPRSFHARLLDRLRAAGARAVAYDVQFTEPSDDPRADNALIDAVARTRNVVLATTEVDAGGRTRIFGGDDVLREIGARAGSSNLLTDAGGRIRRVPYSVEGLRSLPVVAVEAATGRDVERSGFDDGTAWIDFHGPRGTIRSVSFSTVLRGGAPRGLLEDAVVVVGAGAPSLQDVHPTSTTGDGQMAGAEVLANAISTIRRGLPLHEAPTWLEILIISVFGFAAPAAALWVGAMRTLAAAVALAVLYLPTTQLAFEGGAILPVLYPLGALALGTTGSLAVQYLRELLERERQAAIIAMREQFLSSVAHELRTPLTSVKGYTESLLDGDAGDLNEDQRRFVSVVGRNAVRMDRLIGDLLTLSRLEAGRMGFDFEPVRLDELLANLREELEPVARDKGVVLELEAEDGLEVNGDPLRLQQTFANLLSNAIKFTESEGRVRVRGYREAGGVAVEVIDEGIGIPKQEIARLSERYFRTSTAGGVEGTGLGLAIARQIAQRHGGRIEIESVEGGGSTFRVRLPAGGPERRLGSKRRSGADRREPTDDRRGDDRRASD